jgi:hypothetical protein
VPFTIPSHQGIVLPLKLKWPKAIDGLALCVGSIAPDLSYAWLPDLRIEAHSLKSIVAWSLPLALSILPIARYLFLPSVARLHPALATVRAAAAERTSLTATVLCCALGAFSHIMWDGTVMPEGSFPNRYSVLTSIVYEVEPWRFRFRAAWVISSALGALMAVACVRVLWLRNATVTAAERAEVQRQARRHAAASLALGTLAFASGVDSETGAIRALWCVFLTVSLLALFQDGSGTPALSIARPTTIE